MRPFRRSVFCSLVLSAALVLNLVLPSALAVESLPENSITDGHLEDRTTELFACFNGLSPEEEYLVLVSRSSTDPLAPENLLYLTQAESSRLGTLEVPFRAAEQEAVYVAACGQGVTKLVSHSITVEGGSASPEKAVPGAVITVTADDPPSGSVFSGWDIGSGAVTLADASAASTTFVMGEEDVLLTAKFAPAETPKPSAPETSSSSGGSSALLLLGVGTAAAVTAGVVLMMPVEVSGKLETPDHRPVENAVISLSQDGVLFAQTTTNAAGEFGFRVRRGDYELTVLSVSDSGVSRQQTVSIHAPLRSLTLYLSES